MKLNIYGSIFGNDGYSSHTKSLFNALYDIKDLDIKINTQLPQDWIKLCSDREYDCITKKDRKEDWNLIVTIPNMWKLFLGHGKNACYCVWEGDSVPESWLEEFLNPKVDLILVPSMHTRQAIIQTTCLKGIGAENDEIIQNKIRIIPHGVDRNIFYNTNKPKQEEIFTFICNKGWRGTTWDRGGVQYLLRAFAEEFNKDENVKLILKLNPVYINPQLIKQSIDNLNLPENRAPININCGILTHNQLRELYNSADCFVCATRAEAFNLPGLEAMACGLPTIQTNFGGQTDYMTPKNSLFLDCNLQGSEEKPMYEGINWAVPKIEHLRKLLRWAYNNKEKIKEMGNEAEEDSKKFSWENSAKQIYELIK